MYTDAACGLVVASDQGVPDWAAVRQTGVAFVFLRATAGQHWTDPLFSSNWRVLRERELVRGAAHVFRPGLDAFEQAEHFCQTVRLAAGDLPPVLQVLEPGHSSECLAEEITDWLTTVERETGRTPMIHTHPDVWNAICTADFGRYPLWVADYGTSRPRLPLGWHDWHFWQLLQASRKAGLPAQVDLSVYKGTTGDLHHFAEARQSRVQATRELEVPGRAASDYREVDPYLVSG